MIKNRMTAALGRRLRRARIKAGFETTEAGGRAAKIKSSVYWRHENSQSAFGVDFIWRYAQTFGVDPCWLAFGDYYRDAQGVLRLSGSKLVV
jgi:hypothetical protein